MGSALSCLTCTDEETGEERPFLERRPKFENVRHVEGAPVDKKWYHGNISNDEAERRLRIGSAGNDDSYLVYDNPRKAGEYILIVIHKSKFYRWRITRRPRDGQYILGDDLPGAEGFGSVRELVKHHRGVTGKPIKTDSGLTLTLSKSYVYYED